MSPHALVIDLTQQPTSSTPTAMVTSKRTGAAHILGLQKKNLKHTAISSQIMDLIVCYFIEQIQHKEIIGMGPFNSNSVIPNS